MSDPARFKRGTAVRICERDELEEFDRTWQFHHKLEPIQLKYAGATATVEESFMYHGGDIIYKLVGAPGICTGNALRRAR